IRDCYNPRPIPEPRRCSMTTGRCLAVLLLLVGATTVRAGDDYWPRFRGPSGQGVSAETELPLSWSPTWNIAWKTLIPGEVWSSPVIWGNRIFLTTATEKGTACHVLCVDRGSGKILWDREVFQQKTGFKRPKNSYATPTPVTDGERVYAVFG